MSSDRRTWDTPVREQWNPLIHSSLMAVSRHVSLYLETKDRSHLAMAEHLRTYVRELKDWILREETRRGER